MSDYTATIGLEIHAELKTRTKMFCDSANDPDETEPNVNICPVCMGHPGILPVINKEAVKHVLKVGVAVGGTLADFTEFDRKNYFYPDIPKGYQISQYKYPLVSGGSINDIAITRIHLEEDTALSKHVGDHSLIDFNRAGIPLMELVTEPVIHSAEDAVAFAKELRLLLRYLGVAEANMEKGEMRIEANISVSKDDTLGTKTEVKNLNSFRSVERAITYEIERQTGLLESGEKVVQETRGWDENKQATFSQRKKEGSADYRYFPEPDLPKLKLSEISEFAESALRAELPELPWERRERYLSLGLKPEDAEMFVANRLFGVFFDNVVEVFGHPMSKSTWTSDVQAQAIFLAANYITSDVAGLVNEGDEIAFVPKDFSLLIEMVLGGKVSSRGAKDILKIMFEEGSDPQEIAEREGLLQKSDEGELKQLAEQIINDNPQAVEEYKAGKEASLQFLIGQGMKATKGAANPGILNKLLRGLLDK